MKNLVSIGAQDFEYLRLHQYFYIDKTSFIKEWWENGDSVTLITRPRRFGKTLNMSMIEKFFSNQYENRTDLFTGLRIWEEESYHKLQGSYPVIFMSFAGIKGSTYESRMVRRLHFRQSQGYLQPLVDYLFSKREKDKNLLGKYQ